MAREITWHCTYCEGTNKYEDMHCVNCGAARHIDTEFRSIESPEDEKPKQTPGEMLDDIKELTEKAADIYDDVAPIIGALAGLSGRTSRRRRAKRFFE
jgi:hypothetical protein